MHSEKIREPDISTEKDQFQPLDTVSKIVWDNYNNECPSFLTSSWDGYVRYYQIKRVEKRYNQSEQAFIKIWDYYYNEPVLCCQVTPNQIVIAGLANGDIVATSLVNSSQTMKLGFHEAPICQLFWVEQMQLLISVGFDSCLKIWTLQGQNNNFLQKEYRLPIKTVTADYDYPFLLIAGKDSKGTFIEISRETITNLSIPNRYDSFEMELLSTFTCCKLNLDSKTAMLGTVDGRLLNIQFMIENSSYGKSGIRIRKDAIKSRSQKKDIYRGGKSMLGVVSGIQMGSHNGNSIHIAFGTFYLQVYQIQNKKIHMTVKGIYQSAITAAKLCPKNQYLIYACGNDWSKGMESLIGEKRPKIKGIKLKQQEISTFTKSY